MADPWMLAVELFQSAGWAGLALYLLWEAYGPFGYISGIQPGDEDDPDNPVIDAEDIEVNGDLVDALMRNAAAIRKTHENVNSQTEAIANLEELTQEMYRELLSEMKAAREATDS